MQMPGRYGTGDYRYGFQGQEKDEKTGLINYKYRMHDPRIGRFFAVDPLSYKYPYYSPYQFSGNKLIAWVELEGLEEWDVGPNGKNKVYGPYTDQTAAEEGYIDQQVAKFQDFVEWHKTINPENLTVIQSDNPGTFSQGKIEEPGLIEQLHVFIQLWAWSESHGASTTGATGTLVNMGYETLDNVSVFITSWAIVSNDGPYGIDGNYIDPGDRTEKGLQGLITLGTLGMEGVFAQGLQEGNLILRGASSRTLFYLESKSSTWVDDVSGNFIYPLDNGFKGMSNTGSLMEGFTFGRYGPNSGNFAAPIGTAPTKLSLAPGTVLKPYSKYEVIKQIDNVMMGKIAPWFDEQGGGIQYMFDKSVQELLNGEFIKKID